MRHSASNRSRWLAKFSVLLVGLVVVIAIAAAVAPPLLSVGDRIGAEGRSVAAGVIFVGSYLALAIGRIPGLSIDRAGIALVGAGLMVASGALSLEDAYKAVDLDTITLLLGMMIVVASLRLSGFFAVANAWVMAHARRPLILLGAVVATSGVFSAFLVNDAICLVLAPLVLELTLALGRRPVPYLLAVAMASNVGSTATITGNPQNIMIGSFSQIPYIKFALALGPVALVGLIVTVALTMRPLPPVWSSGAPPRLSATRYRREDPNNDDDEDDQHEEHEDLGDEPAIVREPDDDERGNRQQRRPYSRVLSRSHWRAIWRRSLLLSGRLMVRP